MFDKIDISKGLELEKPREAFKISGKLFKISDQLSSKDFEKGLTEIVTLRSRNDQTIKVKMTVQKDDTGLYLVSIDNQEVFNFEEIHPIDEFIVELLEKPFSECKNPEDNMDAFLYLEYMTDVVCEFYRMTFDSRLIQRRIKVSKRKRGVNNRISLENIEATLLHKAWLMLSKIIDIENGIDRPDLTTEFFRKLVFEGLLLMPTMFLDADLNQKKTYLIESMQSENRKLDARDEGENPFPENSFSHTLIDRAIRMANNDPHFHKEYYKPMVVARMQLPKYLFNPKIKLLGKLIQAENRGRSRDK